MKPAFEPIVMGRRPLDGTMVENIRRWGVGPINTTAHRGLESSVGGHATKWPTNVHLNSELAEVLHDRVGQDPSDYFWVSKPPKAERPVVDGLAHPTVKPLDLLRTLVRRVTPPGGLVLDPFMGSGTTIEACLLEGFHVIGIEREATYIPLVEARVQRASETTTSTSASSTPDQSGLF